MEHACFCVNKYMKAGTKKLHVAVYFLLISPPPPLQMMLAMVNIVLDIATVLIHNRPLALYVCRHIFEYKATVLSHPCLEPAIQHH